MPTGSKPGLLICNDAIGWCYSEHSTSLGKVASTFPHPNHVQNLVQNLGCLRHAWWGMLPLEPQHPNIQTGRTLGIRALCAWGLYEGCGSFVWWSSSIHWTRWAIMKDLQHRCHAAMSMPLFSASWHIGIWHFGLHGWKTRQRTDYWWFDDLMIPIPIPILIPTLIPILIQFSILSSSVQQFLVLRGFVAGWHLWHSMWHQGAPWRPIPWHGPQAYDVL